MTDASTVGTTLTIGIDLGDRFSHCCVLDASGHVIEHARVRTTPEAFRARFEQTPAARVVIEAGTHSAWVAECLAGAGHTVVVANPGKLRFIYKSDRFDAEQLARVARLDPRLLSPIQHRSRQTRADLAVLRSRNCLVTARTQLVNHVRGVLKSFGLELARWSTPSFANKVREQIPAELLPALVPIVETIESLSARIRGYDRELTQVAKERYPVTDALRQVSGVGPLTSLAYVLTLEDPRRFRNSRSVGAYLGLRPRKDQSGDKDPELRITKAGDRDLRCLLVQAAHYILGPFGKDSDLRRFGLAMAARGSKVAKRKAVVAVARKLAVLLHSLWRNRPVWATAISFQVARSASCAQSVG